MKGNKWDRRCWLFVQNSTFWISELRANNSEASSCLYRIASQKILPKLISQVGFDNAQDIFHESLMIAYRKLDTFEGRSSFITWVYGISKHVRKRWMEREKTISASENDTAATSPSLEALFIDREERDILRRAIQKLPQSMKFVIVGLFEQDKNPKDLAVELQTTEDNIYQLKRRALLKLRESLKR